MLSPKQWPKGAWQSKSSLQWWTVCLWDTVFMPHLCIWDEFLYFSLSSSLVTWICFCLAWPQRPTCFPVPCLFSEFLSFLPSERNHAPLALGFWDIWDMWLSHPSGLLCSVCLFLASASAPQIGGYHLFSLQWNQGVGCNHTSCQGPFQRPALNSNATIKTTALGQAKTHCCVTRQKVQSQGEPKLLGKLHLEDVNIMKNMSVNSTKWGLA